MQKDSLKPLDLVSEIKPPETCKFTDQSTHSPGEMKGSSEQMRRRSRRGLRTVILLSVTVVLSIPDLQLVQHCSTSSNTASWFV